MVTFALDAVKERLSVPRKPKDPDAPDFFDRNDPDSPVVLAGQQRFFEAIAGVTPDVLTDLLDHVLPLYQSSRDLPGRDAIKATQPAVMKWADRHHLLPLQNWWIPIRALHCLHGWAEDEQSARSLEIPQIPNFPAQLEGFNRRASKFKFAADGWWFEFESQQEFEKRMEKEFRRRLSSYRKTAETAIRKAEYRPTVRKRLDSPEYHYGWVALRVCTRATYKSIADRYRRQVPGGFKSDSVRQAVQRIAKSIGLSLKKRT